MKTFSLAALVVLVAGMVPLAARAESASNEMVCSRIQMLNLETGKLDPNVVAGEFTVYRSPLGLRGLVAEFKPSNSPRIEKDVEITIVTGKAMNHVKELSALVLPDLNFENVKSVRAANIGVKANREDSAGSWIFELRGHDGKVLGKPLQIGWGGGLCGI